MNPMWDGGNMPRKLENSAKSRKAGMSVMYLYGKQAPTLYLVSGRVEQFDELCFRIGISDLQYIL